MLLCVPFLDKMIVKIWSDDRKTKKLAAVDSLDALKQKAIDLAICSDGDIKVCKSC